MTEGNVMSDEEKTAALRKAPVPLFTNQGFPLRPLFDVNGCPIVKNWTEQPEWPMTRPALEAHTVTESVVSDAAVEAAMDAWWCSPGWDSELADSMRRALTAALPHLVAQRDARIKALEEALIRLRDCNWVITLPDRMDAVRAIARAALEKPHE